MAEDHKNYMHDSFPSSKDNEHTPHLKHMHDVTHHDPMLRGRTEEHSAKSGGVGTIQMGNMGNRGTV